jgi:uncharacterized membrane protein YfcA
MIDYLPYLLLDAGIFAGAVVQGMSGFAFSAVAGAVLLHVRPPGEAVPLMMACSIAVQAATLIRLRRLVSWDASIALIAGGALGIPPAIYLLHHTSTRSFGIGFGIFLVAYASWMFFRPKATGVPAAQNRSHAAVVGFAGGLVGGLTAMPGALPTIWCDLRGLSKEQQRGLVQPFIAVMQAFALIMLLARSDISIGVLSDMLIALPALVAGSALGLILFARVNDATFRRVVLALLFVSGLAFVL